MDPTVDAVSLSDTVDAKPFALGNRPAQFGSELPETFGRYRIEKVLGKGGMTRCGQKGWPMAWHAQQTPIIRSCFGFAAAVSFVAGCAFESHLSARGG